MLVDADSSCASTVAGSVSAIILDYYKAEKVVANVQGLLGQSSGLSVEIVVADNSCNSCNAEILRQLRATIPVIDLVINEKNLGYTKGCNRAVGRSRGQYVLICNPDITWPDPTALATMVDYLDAHPDVGIVGPRQVNEADGSNPLTIRGFPNLFTQVIRRTILRTLPILRDIVAYDEMRHLDLGQTQTVDWLQSSCILTRRSFWDRVGGFDERYVLFMADPELCWQAWSMG